MAGNLLRTIGDGTNVYDEGKQQLYLAIQEYDQAVFDLTAIVVAGSVQTQQNILSSRAQISARRQP